MFENAFKISTVCERVGAFLGPSAIYRSIKLHISTCYEDHTSPLLAPFPPFLIPLETSTSRGLADIRRGFGVRVADIVDHCTDTDKEPKPPWRERKEAYIDSLDAKPAESLLVSLADKTHNAEAIVADLERSGSEVWERFTGRREGTIWYYEALVASFARRLPGMEGRFAKAVEQMKSG